MKVHELKLGTKYFGDVADGIKTFEIRENDRDYQIGDLLELRPYSDDGHYRRVAALGYHLEISSKEDASTLLAKIEYMTDYAQQDGYVVLGIKLVDIVDARTKR